MTRIKIKKVKVLDYNIKKNLARLEVGFIKDGNEEKIVRELEMKYPLTLVHSLFLAVKSKDKLIFDEIVSDPLEALEKYSPITIEMEDIIAEKMNIFLTDLCQKAKILKVNTDAKKHMKLLDQFKTAKLEFVSSKEVEKKRDPSYLRMLRRNI
ncbi:MAG: hypothetical protein AABW46_03315 [Nanoarchaeota archaeon]